MTEPSERLKSAVKDVSPCRKEIEVELRADEVGREFEVILDRYAGRARLKGFRPGKAPRDMVRQVYHHEIHESLVESLVPKVLDEVLSSYRIHPVSSPVIDDLGVEDGQPLRFKAQVEVWPDFVLPAYKQIRAGKRSSEVPDADVDKTVEDLRRKAAEYVPVSDRAVAEGDYVVFHLQGRDLKTRRLKPVEKLVVLAGDPGNDPAINAHIPGLRPGEVRDFRHEYPAEGPNKALAGKTIDYRLTIEEIKAQRLPDVNDDFAKSLGDYDGLADLREKIRRELLRVREGAARREVAEDVLRQLVERTEIDLPPSAVDEETEAIMRKAAEQLPPEGLPRAAAETLQARAREQAAVNLKRNLLLHRIAEEERLSVGEEETDAEIRALAQAGQIPPARLMESFNAAGRRENLKNTLLLRKAIDFIVGQAIIE